jgi:thioredoxin reductase
MDIQEIREVVEAFGDAARRVREAGFDALEIPFSHGYLIHQFLSPRSNRRHDRYGGSFENRIRFGMEVLERVREVVGHTLTIVVRMNAADYVQAGLDLDDAVAVASALAVWGVDALSVTSGTMCESVPFCLYPAGTPQAHLLPMAGAIRRAAGVPVIVAGRIRTPAVARQALEAGQADLIGLGRPFLADPDGVRKTEAGDEDGILLCPACHQGCLGSLRKWDGTGCLINPITGREGKLTVQRTSDPREVMIVGGGPAGLEAAVVAASRGHAVSLFEEKEETGGQLALAARVPHKEGFADVVRALELHAVRAGATISRGVRVTPFDILARNPDALILATGGTPVSSFIPGLETIPWIAARDVLRREWKVEGEVVLVVGGGLVGLEVAGFLSALGKVVLLVEVREAVGEKLDPLPRAMLRKRLGDQGVEIRTRTSVTRVAEGRVFLSDGEKEEAIHADLVVLAVGMAPNRELEAALAESGVETVTIGDAREPRGVGEAILEGFEAGAAV